MRVSYPEPSHHSPETIIFNDFSCFFWYLIFLLLKKNVCMHVLIYPFLVIIYCFPVMTVENLAFLYLTFYFPSPTLVFPLQLYQFQVCGKIVRMALNIPCPCIMSSLSVGESSEYDAQYSGDCYFIWRKGDYLSGPNLISQAL